MLPLVGFNIPFKRRNSVDFPAPLFPIKAIFFPLSNERLI
jgi:hypothetical protein